MTIEIKNVFKTFGTYEALKGVSLKIEDGELMALLGPSGSGKTTLLRIIAGLDNPDSGTVLVHGQDLTKQAVRDRQVGFVFQHYSLFKHMTVSENVAFGLRVRPRNKRPSDEEIKRRVNELLGLVQLDRMAARYPQQLSGGQRQRVALARALAIEPKVLLLDEPFGALDARVRKELRSWVRKLHKEINVTSVFVTHDQEEALELADRVAIMNVGLIEQVASPTEAYDRPATAFVSEFLGFANRIDCKVNNGTAHIGGFDVPVDFGTYSGDAVAFVRPHQIELGRPNGHDIAQAKIDSIIALGPSARVDLTFGDGHLEVLIDREELSGLGLAVGDPCAITIRRAHVYKPN
ncbi:MAG TPA: sulfate/molybdate ABC transporter ATP-binding protein [Alphaproteobacteria bacterium]|nr:sulfate/molybdate ABC transporter ATP-binding protein [Alphaproteobacteria bacterium]